MRDGTRMGGLERVNRELQARQRDTERRLSELEAIIRTINEYPEHARLSVTPVLPLRPTLRADGQSPHVIAA